MFEEIKTIVADNLGVDEDSITKETSFKEAMPPWIIGYWMPSNFANSVRIVLPLFVSIDSAMLFCRA